MVGEVGGREERKKALVGGYDDIFPVGKMGKRGPIGVSTRTEKRNSPTSLEKAAAKSQSMESMPPQIMKWKHSETCCKYLILK